MPGVLRCIIISVTATISVSKREREIIALFYQMLHVEFGVRTNRNGQSVGLNLSVEAAWANSDLIFFFI